MSEASTVSRNDIGVGLRAAISVKAERGRHQGDDDPIRLVGGRVISIFDFVSNVSLLAGRRAEFTVSSLDIAAVDRENRGGGLFASRQETKASATSSR